MSLSLYMLRTGERNRVPRVRYEEMSGLNKTVIGMSVMK